MGTSVCLSKVSDRCLRAADLSLAACAVHSGQCPRPAVATTFNDICSSVGPYRVGPSPATLDANPVLGVFRFELALHQSIQSVLRAVPPSALPRRSLAPVALFPRSSGDRSPSLHVPAASLPEVLCPFSDHVVHLQRPASHRQTLALLRRTSNTSRVLSPSSRPCTNTCQACSIPAPLLGFCLQRSVHFLSRTPSGLPCPAVPWQRRSPLGSLCSEDLAVRLR